MSASDTNGRILKMLASRRPRHSLAQEFYVDPDIYAVDLEQIFFRHWLFVGVTSEIPLAGDYFTVSIGGSPIVVIRDRSGKIQAFHNSCRHRGSKICLEERGHAAVFVCPYHQWSYSLSGELLSGHRDQNDFVAAEHNLKPVHIKTISGVIFICLADQPPDFSLHRDTVEPYLASQNLDNAKLAYQIHWPVRGNWKLMVENSRECYHCQARHPELVRTFEILDYDRTDVAHAELRKRCATAGLAAALKRGNDFQIIRVPFADDTSSVTMDGKPAVSKLLGTLPVEKPGSLRWAHFPTLYANVYPDHAFLLRMLPVGPQESVLTGKWLVPADALPDRDYALENLIRVWAVTSEQDKRLIEHNQEGVNSRGYQAGPYSERNEPGVIRFVDWYCGTIECALGRSSQKQSAAA